MAKPTREQSFDDDDEFTFDFDDLEGGVNDFADPEAKKKNRNPVMSVASGFKSGVTDSITNPGFMKKVTLGALPKEYSESVSVVSDLAGGVQDIKQAVSKELKPTATALVRQVDKLVPENFKRSKAVVGKLKGLLGIDDHRSGFGTSEEERQEISIQEALSQVFDKQLEVNRINSTTEAIRDTEKSIKDDKRASVSAELARESGQHIAKLSAIADQITVPYYRKSLEIQYRQFFATKTLVDKSVEHFKLMHSLGEAISKNTALPEYTKLTTYERGAGGLLNKLGEQAFGGLFGGPEMLARAKTGGLKKIKGGIRDFGFGLEQGLGFVESINQGRDMMKDMESAGMSVDGNEELAKGATDYGMGIIGNKVGSKVRAGISDNGAIAKAGYGAANLTSGLIGAADRARGAEILKEKEDDGILKTLFRSAGRAITDLPFAAVGMKVTAEKNFDPDYPVNYDYGSRQSIVTVIPGLLSRILRETQIIRTGDSSIGLTSWDGNSGKFSTNQGIKDDIRTRMESLIDKERYDKQANAVLDKAVGGEDKLSPELRKKLNTLLKESGYASEEKRGAVHDAASLRSEHFLNKLTEEERAEYLAAMDEVEKADINGKHKMELTRTIGSLRGGVKDTRREIQRMIAEGKRDQLVEMGLITESGRDQYLNFQQQIDYATGKSERVGDIKEETLAGDALREGEGSSRGTRPTPKPVTVNVKGVETAQRKTNTLMQELIGEVRGIKSVLSKKKKDGEDDVPVVSGFDMYKEPVDRMVELLTIISEKPSGGGGMTAEQMAEFKSIFTGFGEKLASFNVSEKLETVLNGFASRMEGLGLSDRMSDVLNNLNSTLTDIRESGGFASGMGTAKGYAGAAGGVAWRAGKLGVAAGVIGGTWAGKKAIKLGETAREVITGPVKDVAKEGGSFIGNTAADMMERLNDRFLSEEERAEKKRKRDAGELPEKDDTPTGILKRVRDQSFSLIGNTFDTVNDAVTDLYKNKLPAGWATVIGTAKLGIQKGIDAINKPRDLYLPSRGMEQPVLRAAIMRIGGYVNVLDGKRIFTVNEIKGPVKDFQTGEVLVTMEEFGEGLVDVSGKRVGSTLQQVRNLVSPTLGKIGGFLGKYSPIKVPDSIKERWKKVSDAYGQRHSPEGFKQYHAGEGDTAVGNTQVALLTDIRDILSRMSGGGVTGLPGLPKLPSLTTPSAITRETVKETFDNLQTSATNIGAEALVRAERVKVKGQERVAKAFDKVSEKASKMKGDVTEKAANLIDKVKIDRGADSDEAGSMENQRWLSKIYTAITNSNKDGEAGATPERAGGFRGRLNAMLAKRKAAKEEKLASANGEGKPARGNLFDKLGAGAMGILGGAKDAVMDGAGMATDAYEAWRDGRAPGGPPDRPEPRARGRMGRLWQGARSVGRGALRAAGSAVNAGGRVVASSLGRIALATVLGGAQMGAVTAVAGSVLTGIAGFLASPVVLGAGAVALAGYGGYKAFQYFTRNNMGDLVKHRYLQYGFSEAESDHFHRLASLEEAVKDAVMFTEGRAEFIADRLDLKKILDVFEITDDDQAAMANLVNWLDSRFKPIYLTHRTALLAIEAKRSLADVDDMAPDLRLRYLEASSFPNAPYHITQSPIKDIESLSGTKALVTSSYEALKASLVKEGAKPASPESVAATAAAAAGALGSKTVMTGGNPEKASAPNFVRIPGAEPNTGNMAGMLAGGVAGAAVATAAMGNEGAAIDPAYANGNVPSNTAVNNQPPMTEPGDAAQPVAIDGRIDPQAATGDFATLPTQGRLSSKFGMRTHPISGKKKMHQGIDIAAPAGTPVRTPAAGVVAFAGTKGGYGNTIIVQHENGLQTLYAHLEGFEAGIKTGAVVEKGQAIAGVGSTGASTGNHLHYEIRKTKNVKLNLPTQQAPATVPAKLDTAAVPSPKGESAVAGAGVASGVDPNRYYDLTAADRADSAARKAAKEKGGFAGSVTTTSTPKATGGALTGATQTGSGGDLESMSVEVAKKLLYDHPALDAYARKVEQQHGLPAGLMVAIKNAGERSNSWQVSSAGARGVMQMMPVNLEKFGVKDATNPKDVIDGAGRYFKETRRQYKGDIWQMVADYNGGPRQAKYVKNGQEPAAKETRNYLQRVKAYLGSGAATAVAPSTGGDTGGLMKAVEKSSEPTVTPDQAASVSRQMTSEPAMMSGVNHSGDYSAPSNKPDMSGESTRILSDQLSVLRDIRDILSKGTVNAKSSQPDTKTATESPIPPPSVDAAKKKPAATDSLKPEMVNAKYTPPPKPEAMVPSSPSIKRGITA